MGYMRDHAIVVTGQALVCDASDWIEGVDEAEGTDGAVEAAGGEK